MGKRLFKNDDFIFREEMLTAKLTGFKIAAMSVCVKRACAAEAVVKPLVTDRH